MGSILVAKRAYMLITHFRWSPKRDRTTPYLLSAIKSKSRSPRGMARQLSVPSSCPTKTLVVIIIFLLTLHDCAHTIYRISVDAVIAIIRLPKRRIVGEEARSITGGRRARMTFRLITSVSRSPSILC
jgi:hypothetical protein